MPNGEGRRVQSGRPLRSIFSICAASSGAEAGRCGSARHRVHLRKIDPEDRRHRRFCRCWKRHCFAWEYKGKRKNLVQAYAQLKQYADAFENPPLLIVSDMQEIRVHTNFTNAIAQQHVIPLGELSSVEARELLRNCFLDPERLLPTETRESVTAKAAAEFRQDRGRAAPPLRRAPRRPFHQQAQYSASSPRISSSCPTASSPTSSTSR